MSEIKTEGMCLPYAGADTRDWYAWLDLQPPKPDFFHIVGEVLVPNPGVDPLLVPATPQGTTATTLILDLYLCQRPGIWPQVTVWKSVGYEKKIGVAYTHAEIRSDGKTIAKVDVKKIS